MSYNKYARFTFKTPEGRCFLANKATIRKEYERWLAAELRRKIQVRNAAKTSGVIKHEKVDFQVTTTRGETVERGRPTTRKTTISSSVGTKRFYETRDLKAKRKATSAADDERPAKKRKTQHVAGILKVHVPGSSKDAKQVRWCTSVQEPRVTVRAKIVRISCPEPTPATSPATTRSLEFEDFSRTARSNKPLVERYTRSLPLPPWNYRHALYHEIKKMDYSLDQWIETMAERGSPTALLLVAPRA